MERKVVFLDVLKMKGLCSVLLYYTLKSRRALISVKRELNRLYILGTLITWFASYPAKSS